MHWDTHLHAINDLHKVYWSQFVLLHSRKGKSVHIWCLIFNLFLTFSLCLIVLFYIHWRSHSWFKVIDEVLHVLCTIAHTKFTNSCSSEVFILAERPLRTHEVLQELRDISSMAIEHFEEKVAPTLKKAYCELPIRSSLNCSTVQFQCKKLIKCFVFLFTLNIFMHRKKIGRKSSECNKLF